MSSLCRNHRGRVGRPNTSILLKFLVDNALPPKLARLLNLAGHDAKHVRDFQMQDASDIEILALARSLGFILISADSDFATLLALQSAPLPSFILFREPDLLLAEDFTARLIATLPLLQIDLKKGAVVVYRRSQIRIRKLPVEIPPTP